MIAVIVAGVVALAAAEVRFQENFDDASWESRWVTSQAKSDFGKFELTAGDFSGDESDLGIKTSQDAKFYAMGTTFDEFSNEGKPLVIALTVKHEQKIDCGGGYVKVLGGNADLEGFTGDSPYDIMFGPDICGPPTKKIHLIFSYKGENLLWKKTPKAETDQLTHLYTAIVYPDNTYAVEVDGKEVESGNLVDDWEFLPPKEIKDPESSKPEDWVDEAKMDDPEDAKPDGWDDEPEFVADPEAEKPEDWDDELDGEWEAPLIENPDFKGEWSPRQIDNPDYKGPWVHPMIPNPEYDADAAKDLYKYQSVGGIAIDIWQVKSGTIFDHIFISDDLESYREWEKFFGPFQEAEQAVWDKMEAERKAKEEEERARLEEERLREEAEAEEEDEDEEDDEPEHDEL